MGLSELHDDIERHFTSLSGGREGPSWVIEHAVTRAERERARAWLSEALSARGLDGSVWWRMRSWPLLVEAAEIGYAYEGPGGRYWPTLADWLGYELSYAEQVALSGHFEALTQHLARPPSDPWSERFRHIAWPVTHALLPIGAQLNLFAAIIDHDERLNLRHEPEDAVVQLRRRVEARHPRSRLLPLLGQPPVAASVICALLGVPLEGAVISRAALQRFEADAPGVRALALRRGARRRVARDSARLAISGGARQPRRRRPKEGEAPPARLNAPLHVYRGRVGAANQWSLFVAPPPLPGSLRAAVPVLPFKPLGVGRGASLSSVARGASFPLGAARLPDEERLIPNAAELIADEHLALRLAALHVDLREPIVFAPAGGDLSSARQVTTRSISGGGPWLALARRRAEPPDARALGEVAGLRLSSFGGPLTPAQRRWCAESDIGVVDVARLGLFEPPQPTPDGAEPPEWIAGSTAYLRVGEQVGSASITCGAAHVEAPEGGVVACPIDGAEPGEITIEWRDLQRSVPFTTTPMPPRAPVVTVNLVGEPNTLDALRTRALGVALYAETPLAGLSVGLSLTGSTGSVSAAAFNLPPLPLVIGAEHEAMAELLRAAERAGAWAWDQATLSVEVGALARQTWLLEEEPRRAWWRPDREGWRAEGDARGWGAGALTLNAPWRQAAYQRAQAAPIAALVPVDERGEPLLSAGLVLCPESVDLSNLVVSTPARTLRSVERGLKSGANAAEIAEGWLAWRLAEARRPVADIVRRRAAAVLEMELVSVTCGDPWAAVERPLSEPSGARDLSAAVTESIIAAELSRDDQFDDALARHASEEQIADEVRGQLSSWIERHLPVFAGAAELGVDDDLAEWLDDGLGGVLVAAWRALAPRAPLDPNDKPDLGHEPAEWERTLRATVLGWRRRREVGALLELIRPIASAPALAAMPFGSITDEELIHRLQRWHKDAAEALFTGPGRARPWHAEIVEDLYDLWQRPLRVADGQRWRESLAAALGSQFACRAIRYAVVRRRAALAGEGAL